MQRINILLFLLVVCFATAIQAETQAPKPNPELKKLQVLVGHWTYEGEHQAGSLGPGGKVTGEYINHMILGGSFLQARSTAKSAGGERRNLRIDGYDPVNKNFTSTTYLDDGSRFSGTLTVSGNTFTWEGTSVAAGKPYLLKHTFIFAPDWMSGRLKGETSVDGKTWTPFLEAKWTKTKPTPKK